MAGTGAGVAADPLGEFDVWLGRYEAASAAEQPGLVAEGEALQTKTHISQHVFLTRLHMGEYIWFFFA